MDYGALIQELGGEYIDLDYFTTSCTHIVVGVSLIYALFIVYSTVVRDCTHCTLCAGDLFIV